MMLPIGKSLVTPPVFTSQRIKSELIAKIESIFNAESASTRTHWSFGSFLCPAFQSENLSTRIEKVLRGFNYDDFSRLSDLFKQKIQEIDAQIIEQERFIEKLKITNNDKTKNSIHLITGISSELKQCDPTHELLGFIHQSSEDLLALFEENSISQIDIKNKVNHLSFEINYILNNLDDMSLIVDFYAEGLRGIAPPSKHIYQKICCCLVPKIFRSAIVPSPRIREEIAEIALNPLIEQGKELRAALQQMNENKMKIESLMLVNNFHTKEALLHLSSSSDPTRTIGSSDEQIKTNIFYSVDNLMQLFGIKTDCINEINPMSLSEAEKVLRGKRILLVDDSQSILKMVKRNLEAHGMIVETAEDGQQAFNEALKASEEKAPFDFVIMDIRMPNCDGLQGTELIRKKWSRLELPVLAVSGEAQTEELLASVIRVGMNKFLAKPAKKEALLPLMASILLETERIKAATLEQESVGLDIEDI